jgi:hypothetical protein
VKKHFLSVALLSVFGALFISHLFPVWTTHIPGGLEDTNLFLWNAWWYRYALHTLHQSPYFTHLLFHPFGTSLLSNDMPLWNALVTLTAQAAGWNLIAASNLCFLLSWILDGACVYFLVFEITRRSSPALVAGLYVMTSAYLLARGMQNWGQFNLFGIALFLGALVRADRLQTRTSQTWAGTTLAWTAACHYYFLVYSFVTVLALDAWRLAPWTVRFRWRASGQRIRLAENIFLSVAAAAAAVAAWIGWAHPADLQWGSFHIGLQSVANALIIFWTFLAAWFISRSHWRFDRRVPAVEPQTYARRRAWLYGAALLWLSPLWISAIHLVLRGGYPRQSILWKTHLAGANLFSLFLPNPCQVFWGAGVSQWLAASGIQPQEQAASLGWIFLAVLALARPWRTEARARHWILLAGAATIFSMGTYLEIWKWNLWLPLPFFGLRLLPILSNVRVPERWMALGTIAWAVVLALALCQLGKKSGKLKRLCLIVGVLILFENWPGLPVVPAPLSSSVYTRLRDEPQGAVLALPLIIGDSSICVGNALPNRFPFPWQHLWAQTCHHHAILGGYIGRIPKHLIADYKKDPFFGTLLALEEGAPAVPADPSAGCAAIKNFTFDYVLSYPSALPPAADTFARGSLPLRLIEKDQDVSLYRLDLSACSSERQ